MLFSKLVLLALCCLALFAIDVKGSGEPADSEVIVLDHTNFDAKVKEHADMLLVEFYAPWCGHCKKLSPEYTAAAKTLKAHDPPIAIAKIDASAPENKNIAAKYGIKGFPTLKIFKGSLNPDDVTAYGGSRTASGIHSYMSDVRLGKTPKVQQPPAKPPAKPIPEPAGSKVAVLDEKNFDGAITAGIPVLVEFYAPWCGHCKKLVRAYAEASIKLAEQNASAMLAKVDATENRELAQKYGVKGYPTLLLFKDGNIDPSSPTKYAGPRDANSILNYMLNAAGETIAAEADAAKAEL